ncbi:conserved hypothetical protein [Ricinus communis]|uniref:SHSP domain-containing protein n=2 Tax=Ricinus communis TaxID=3988 RepID=B9SSG6_RICCO|nr:conserved hypothetical protein [Ricinus communis]
MKLIKPCLALKIRCPDRLTNPQATYSNSFISLPMANVIVNIFPHSSGGFYASNNQFQINGTRGYSESKTLPRDQLFVRIDLPGVSKEAIRYSNSSDKKMIFFQGEAPQISPFEEGHRTFLGGVGVSCKCCQLAGLKSDMRDGVLRMVLQKVSVKRRRQETPCSNDGFVGAIDDNPYVKSGSKKGFEAKPTKEGGLFLRIDMPGVAKQDSRVWMMDGEVRFLGKARKIIKHDVSGREYLGSISLFPIATDHGDGNCGSSSRIRGKIVHEMKDGVLRIMIPPA